MDVVKVSELKKGDVFVKVVNDVISTELLHFVRLQNKRCYAETLSGGIRVVRSSVSVILVGANDSFSKTF